jgi:hypothetical protein
MATGIKTTISYNLIRPRRTRFTLHTSLLTLFPRPTPFSLLTSNFSLPHLCTYKLKKSNEPNLHNFFTISLHFLTSPSSGQGNPNESRRLLKIPNEPIFQTSRQPVTLDMIRTYNEDQPKKRKKSKPKPNPMQSQSKPDPNPIQTLSKPKPNPISAPKTPPALFVSRFSMDNLRAIIYP